jgi:tRNA ligase
VLGPLLTGPNAPAGARDFWDRLVSQKRVAGRPHVTLAHTAELASPGTQALWDACARVAGAASPPTFRLRLSHLVWDARVMALAVDNLAVSADAPDDDAVGAEFVVGLDEAARRRLHVTVGTWAPDVKPFEAKALVERWRRGEAGPEAMPLGDVFVQARLKGLMS